MAPTLYSKCLESICLDSIVVWHKYGLLETWNLSLSLWGKSLNDLFTNITNSILKFNLWFQWLTAHKRRKYQWKTFCLHYTKLLYIFWWMYWDEWTIFIRFLHPFWSLNSPVLIYFMENGDRYILKHFFCVPCRFATSKWWQNFLFQVNYYFIFMSFIFVRPLLVNVFSKSWTLTLFQIILNHPLLLTEDN